MAALKSYGSETVSSSGLSQATLVKSVMRNLSSEVKLLSAIRVSDDLTKYQKQMYLGVARLVKDKKCDLREIEYFGGWVKSGQRKGQYFMDCGNTRHWLNPANNSAKVTTDDIYLKVQPGHFGRTLDEKSPGPACKHLTQVLQNTLQVPLLTLRALRQRMFMETR